MTGPRTSVGPLERLGFGARARSRSVFERSPRSPDGCPGRGARRTTGTSRPAAARAGPRIAMTSRAAGVDARCGSTGRASSHEKVALHTRPRRSRAPRPTSWQQWSRRDARRAVAARPRRRGDDSCGRHTSPEISRVVLPWLALRREEKPGSDGQRTDRQHERSSPIRRHGEHGRGSRETRNRRSMPAVLRRRRRGIDSGR